MSYPWEEGKTGNPSLDALGLSPNDLLFACIDESDNIFKSLLDSLPENDAVALLARCAAAQTKLTAVGVLPGEIKDDVLVAGEAAFNEGCRDTWAIYSKKYLSSAKSCMFKYLSVFVLGVAIWYFFGFKYVALLFVVSYIYRKIFT